MNPIGTFFVANTFSVFFVYGLAYFVMGLVITIEARRVKDSPFAMSLWPLAIFGFLHSLVEWNDMLLLVQPSVSAISGSPLLQGTKVILLGVSTFFLVLFGANTISAILQRRRWLRILPYVLLVAWVLSPAVLPHMITVTSLNTADTVNSCLICHSPGTKFGIIHLGSWYPTASVAEVWARYLLYLPGCLLTAIAWWLRAKEMQRRGLPLIAHDCKIATLAFGLNTIFAGIIVSPAPYFPASVLNYNNFTSLVGVQPQVLRALMAMVIAVIVVRILRIFEVERESQLRQVRLQRLQTEIESNAKVSAAYEEISALQSVVEVAGRSLHLRESMASVLAKVLETMSLPAGAIFTWEPGVRSRYLFQQQGFDLEAWQAFLASDPELKLLYPKEDDGREGTIFLSDAANHPIAAALPADLALSSLACVPLRSKDASVGILMVASLGNRTLTVRDRSLLGSIAQHVVVALDNARLYESAQHSLEIQGMLTQEMNHRVKNNLQTIADILTLQLRRQDQTTDEALANSISRIKAMAVVHDLLAYQSETSISVKAVIDELAQSITQQVTGKRIHLAVSGPELSLPLKQATSLSLSLNELITNAAKHGFAGRDRGEITITISLDNNLAHFAVSDDGVGLTPDFNLSRNSRLGLRIVEGLVTRELKGTVSFESRQGTTAIITFPCLESAPALEPVSHGMS